MQPPRPIAGNHTISQKNLVVQSFISYVSNYRPIVFSAGKGPAVSFSASCNRLPQDMAAPKGGEPLLPTSYCGRHQGVFFPRCSRPEMTMPAMAAAQQRVPQISVHLCLRCSRMPSDSQNGSGCQPRVVYKPSGTVVTSRLLAGMLPAQQTEASKDNNPSYQQRGNAAKPMTQRGENIPDKG